MQLTSTRIPRGRAMFYWLTSALFGAAVLLWLIPDFYVDTDRTLSLLWWLFAGTVALLTFAVTVLSGPPQRLGVGDVVVLFFGMAGPLGMLPSLVTLAMASSWLRWRTALLALLVALVGVVWDNFLLSAGSVTDGFSAGQIALLGIAVVIGVLVGLRRKMVAVAA